MTIEELRQYLNTHLQNLYDNIEIWVIAEPYLASSCAVIFILLCWLKLRRWKLKALKRENERLVRRGNDYFKFNCDLGDQNSALQRRLTEMEQSKLGNPVPGKSFMQVFDDSLVTIYEHHMATLTLLSNNFKQALEIVGNMLPDNATVERALEKMAEQNTEALNALTSQHERSMLTGIELVGKIMEEDGVPAA